MAEIPSPNACVDLHFTPNDTGPLITIPRLCPQNTAPQHAAIATDSTSLLKSLHFQLLTTKHTLSMDAQSSLSQACAFENTLSLFTDMSNRFKEKETQLEDAWAVIQGLLEENDLVRYMLVVSELRQQFVQRRWEKDSLELGRSRYTAFAVNALQKKFAAEEAQAKLSDALKQLAECQDALRQSISLLSVSTGAMQRVDGEERDVEERMPSRELAGPWEVRRDATVYAFKRIQIWNLSMHESWYMWVCALVLFIVMKSQM